MHILCTKSVGRRTTVRTKDLRRKSKTNKDFALDEAAFDNYPQQPHGGKLVDRVATGKEREEGLERAKNLPKIMVDLEAAITLELIATGVMSPHEGLMVEEEYLSSLETGRLTRSEEHTSELQSRGHLVCRLLLEKKKIGFSVFSVE